jgi:hypothetical protein
MYKSLFSFLFFSLFLLFSSSSCNELDPCRRRYAAVTRRFRPTSARRPAEPWIAHTHDNLLILHLLLRNVDTARAQRGPLPRKQASASSHAASAGTAHTGHTTGRAHAAGGTGFAAVGAHAARR